MYYTYQRVVSALYPSRLRQALETVQIGRQLILEMVLDLANNYDECFLNSSQESQELSNSEMKAFRFWRHIHILVFLEGDEVIVIPSLN